MQPRIDESWDPSLTNSLVLGATPSRTSLLQAQLQGSVRGSRSEALDQGSGDGVLRCLPVVQGAKSLEAGGGGGGGWGGGQGGCGVCVCVGGGGKKGGMEL